MSKEKRQTDRHRDPPLDNILILGGVSANPYLSTVQTFESGSIDIDKASVVNQDP